MSENMTPMGKWMEEGGMKDVKLSPDEENWASWKCDGGPHQSRRTDNFTSPPSDANKFTPIEPLQNPEVDTAAHEN